jgi:hypothetical protein
MKKIFIVVSILLASMVQAKDYTVTLDDKYVPYFEAKEEVSEIGAEEWFRLQAINEADKMIDKKYLKIKAKNRDEKISELEKKKIEE